MAKIKPHKKIRKQRIPSNKGVSSNSNHSSKTSNNNIAYKYNNYYITIPIIDKIVICGDLPQLSAEELALLNGYLYLESRDDKSSKPIVKCMDTDDWKGFWNNKRLKTDYRNHFKITPPDSNEFILISFEQKIKSSGYVNKGQRFLRLEFNPQKLGEKNVKWFIDWYNETIPHCKFEDLISVKKCINMMHVAVDVIGIHISDMLFDLEDEGKSNSWHSEAGLLETYYLKAKRGRASK